MDFEDLVEGARNAIERVLKGLNEEDYVSFIISNSEGLPTDRKLEVACLVYELAISHGFSHIVKRFSPLKGEYQPQRDIIEEGLNKILGRVHHGVNEDTFVGFADTSSRNHPDREALLESALSKAVRHGYDRASSGIKEILHPEPSP